MKNLIKTLQQQVKEAREGQSSAEKNQSEFQVQVQQDRRDQFNKYNNDLQAAKEDYQQSLVQQSTLIEKKFSKQITDLQVFL